MLPSGSSSVQKRRMLHRRQQSLEVPILAPNPPTNPRRTQTGRTGHRRGLSLDQSLSALGTPHGSRPLPFQDTNPIGLPLGPSARTQPDPHPGQQQRQILPDQQHLIKQETQAHSLAQPGYMALPLTQHAHDFHTHLQHQLNGTINPSTTSPSSEQIAAMQHLQNHLAWYKKNFGNAGVGPSVQAVQYGQSSLAGSVDPSMYAVNQPIVSVLGQHASTVPSSPQDFTAGWPSPPPSQMKQARSQSYQLDVAPMPRGVASSARASSTNAFGDESSFSAQAEHEYAPSNYSSSVVDASSPSQQHSTPMPTLFEEDPSHSSDEPGAAGELLLQAAAGAEMDFNSPNFIVGGDTVCAEQAALDAAGIDATYIDNGITEEHINSFLVWPSQKGDAFICTYENCGAKVNRRENARAHVQNHLDDRKYQCNVCEKRFTRSHDTKRHAMTHTNERPAICPCGRRFARADALTRHRQRDMCVGVLPGFEKDPEDKPKRGRPKKDRSGHAPESSNKKRTSRPDMDARAHKAALARAMDRGYVANGQRAYSVSSSFSQHSLPETPPHDGDSMDTNDFLNMDGAENQFNNGTSSWLDTPPTSPPSASPSKTTGTKKFMDLIQDDCVSPSKLSTRSSPPIINATIDHNALLQDYSSPAAHCSNDGFHGGSSPIDPTEDIFNSAVNFDVMNSHPDVGQDVFSPPGESCSNSSVYNSDFDAMHVSHVKIKPSLPTIYDDRCEKNGLDDPFSDGLDGFSPMSPADQFGDFRDMLDSWLAHN